MMNNDECGWRPEGVLYSSLIIGHSPFFISLPQPDSGMPTPLTTAEQRRLIDELAELAQRRADDQERIEQRFATRDAELRTEFAQAAQQRKTAYEQQTSSLNEEYTDTLAEARDEHGAVIGRLIQDEKEFAERAPIQTAQVRENAQDGWDRAKLKAKENHHREASRVEKELQALQQVCATHRYELQVIGEHVKVFLRQRRCGSVPDGGEPVPVEPPSADRDSTALERAISAKDNALVKLSELDKQRAARYLDEGWIFLFFLLGAAVAVVPSGLLFNWADWRWAALSAGVGVAVAAVAYMVIYPVVRRQTRQVVGEIQRYLAAAREAVDDAEQETQSNAEKQLAELAQQQDHDLGVVEEFWSQRTEELNRENNALVAREQADLTQRRATLDEQWEASLRPHKEKYPALLQQAEQDFEREEQRHTAEHDAAQRENREQHDRDWEALIERWQSGIARFESAVTEMTDYCAQRYPAWPAIDWEAWSPPSDSASALPFGGYEVHLDELPGGVPSDERLMVDHTQFTLPSVLSFPETPSLLIEASDEGRDTAVATLQNAMLRFLIAMPPGKVRFTIIDPTALGQNFSAFMHLADFDERLVNNRIWTEAIHINQRLMDLTQHMEDVIQKYLRNEFESIQEYNQHAGEVAEAFQILVIANFPAGFSEEAGRRLVSIASSGARCGVYTLISCDTKMELPRNFDLADLKSSATTLQWSDGRFRFEQDDLGHWPLALDQPPEDDLFTAAVRAVGSQAKDSNRVEVPFTCVAPSNEQWWTGDSRAGVEVALGRAGATKLQYLHLGEGTSQHVLIAGKTGSGKSTMLHALITNAALHYGPDELHFYLIDFKKGVEFKPYSTFQLPQARVIAIESEREFGLSVLERLDVELHRRGDLFRSAGVQNVKAYRDAHPAAVMPRILLIIDEFQELFVKDDKIAADAALLLDRLVRQGRAFGIHVLLGSQTLAGAYSLARSTIGQMAVRIALQCSDSDAHLILSEDNTAARLLNRPGEAIYNNANGLFEGNYPFQVVWLPDNERGEYLRQLQELAEAQDQMVEPPIVFEGNVAADPSRNALLRGLLQSPTETAGLAPHSWLGAAVAIKEPTACQFRRQSGANLMVVGQQEEMAMGVLANCLISLGAQLPRPAMPGDAADSTNSPPGGHRFYLFDGTRAESPDADFWRRLVDQLPLDIELIPPRDVDDPMAEIAAEVNRRLEQGDDTLPPIFLIVYNLGRFRDLRKPDDAFNFGGFGDDDQPPSPAIQFATILREGPALGVHTLLWADTFTSVSRWLDRQSIRDVEMRALFQMSPTDSANLMDSPEASRLGVNRAVLYSDEQGDFEKFRPYGIPSGEWLSWIREQLIALAAFHS